MYQCWLDGKTVDEAAQLTRIPRSTVGYYYRKFNRAAKTGAPLNIPTPKPQTPKDAYESALSKAWTFSQLVESMEKQDFQTSYYMLSNKAPDRAQQVLQSQHS